MRESLLTTTLAGFDLIPPEQANEKLVEWGHWLGGNNRPFGRQAFGLTIEGELLSVACSASTVNKRCAGYERTEVVELVRLCSHPDHRDLTRVALRLWRKLAPITWGRVYWPVDAVVSYSNSTRHSGDIYRFDGWTKVTDTRGGTAGGGWNRGKKYDPKKVWAFPLTPAGRSALADNPTGRKSK